MSVHFFKYSNAVMFLLSLLSKWLQNICKPHIAGFNIFTSFLPLHTYTKWRKRCASISLRNKARKFWSPSNTDHRDDWQFIKTGFPILLTLLYVNLVVNMQDLTISHSSRKCTETGANAPKILPFQRCMH